MFEEKQKQVEPAATTEPAGGDREPSGVLAAVDKPPGPPRSQRLLIQLLVACIIAVAGAAGSQVIWATHEFLHVPTAELGMPPHPPPLQARIDRYNFWNAVIGFGGAGAIVCTAIGVAVGVLLRSAKAAILGAVTGLGAGLLMGAIGGPITTGVDARLLDYQLDDIFRALLIHLGNWLLLGVATGIVLCVAIGPWTKAAEYFAATIVAGLVAAVLYPIVVTVVMPTAYSALAVPFQAGARILWFSLGAAVLGWAAARVAILRYPAVARRDA